MATQKASAGGGTDFDVVLKEFYEGPVREHLNNKITILQYVEKSKRKWNGRRVLFPVHLRRNHGVGARGESGTLPTAGRQEYVESKINSKFMYGRIELTGVVIAASEGDKGAFASALRTEVEGLRRDLRVDMNRQVWGNPVAATDGTSTNTGILAQLNAEPGSLADEGSATFTFDNPGTRYLKPGMKLAFGTATGANAGTVKTAAAARILDVTAITSTTQATLKNNTGGAVNLDINDVCVLGDSSDNSFNKEITGLSFMVTDADDDFQTVDTGLNPEWKANVLDNSGENRPLSLELMQLAIDTADEVAGGEPNLVMGHHSIRREYINLLTSDVRYAPEQLKGGFQKLTYAGGTTPMPLEFDRMAPYNKLFFLNTNDIKLYVMKDWAFADRDGSTFSRMANSDSWEAFMCWYGNMGLERRFSQTVLTDISVDNLIF
jgi:hypothetical protein